MAAALTRAHGDCKAFPNDPLVAGFGHFARPGLCGDARLPVDPMARQAPSFRAGKESAEIEGVL